MKQRLYRVPYRLHDPRARTKASICYDWEADTGSMRPADGASIIEFHSPSHAEAVRALQKAILPDDDRPIMGRSNVRWFAAVD